ncbi:MAG: XRE family transcriptional regulator [Clostridia bacterium]|nr:XRE family transcriptional regulator [Clostridia bacterium]
MFENRVLAENIKIHRKQNKMTQSQLAGRLYVTAQTISKWENGLSVPELDNLCEIADIFGVSVDALLRSSSRENKTMIAIDGGGTKTEFIHFDENGKILGRVLLGGTNPNLVGLDNAVSTLLQGIDLLHTNKGALCGIFAGVAGCALKQNSERLAKEIKKNYPQASVSVESDIHCVINSVRGLERSIAVICGTGSVVYANDGNELHRIGGWGYIFDKAGSGFDIGRDAICAALEYENGFAPASYLTDAVRERIGGDIMESFDMIYSKGRDYIASFSRLVFDAHSKGDKVAKEIIRKTTDRIAFLVNHAYKKYDCGNEVVISGGITSHREVLESMIYPKLEKGLKLMFPEFPQIYGACLKCMNISKIEVDADTFDENFRNYTADK